MIEFLRGKKTYIVSGASAIYALIGWHFGWITPETAQQIIQVSLVGAGLRAAK